MEERIEKFFPEKEGDSALILVEFVCWQENQIFSVPAYHTYAMGVCNWFTKLDTREHNPSRLKLEQNLSYLGTHNPYQNTLHKLIEPNPS